MLKKRITAVILVLLMCLPMVPVFPAVPVAGDTDRVNLLADEELAPGIHYTEEDHLDYQGTGRRTRINRMEIVPNESLQIISSKAQDTVNALESVEKQAEREMAKGNNVVASINADTFDMYTTNGGIPTGMQIQNGAIVVSQPNDYYNTGNNPCFFVHEDGSFDIGPLLERGSITVGDGFEQEVNLINRTNFLNRFAGVARSYENYRIYTSSAKRDRTMHLNAADDPNVPDAQMPEDMSYALIRISDFDGMIRPNVTYTGKVISIHTEEGFTIPDDCIVLAGFNDAAPSVEGLKAGETVVYECHLYTGDFTGGYDGAAGQADGKATPVGEPEELTDIVTAISSFQHIAEDGNILVDPSNSYDGKNARTLLGITADGKLQVVTINESGDLMGPSLTDGSTFQEMADYMVNSLGCEDVINLDSGGSAEMAVRRAGSEEVTQASYPSDGGSRSVTNALLFVSNAARTAELGTVVVDGSTHIYKGSHTAYSVRLTDTNDNPLILYDVNITWNAEYGTIDENGNYTAPEEPCEDTVTATVNGVEGISKVAVVGAGDIATVSMTPSGTLSLDKGDTKQFEIKAYTADKQTVAIDNSVAEWTISGDLGIVENGLLTVTVSEGVGAVSSAIFDQTFTTNLIVGIKEQTIEDFEQTPVEGVRVQRLFTNSSMDYGSVSSSVYYDVYQAKDGNNCLLIDYDSSFARNINIYFRFAENNDAAGNGIWNETTRAAMEQKYIAMAMPKSIGLWVYGDNSGSALWAGVRTSYQGSAGGTQTGENKPNLSLGRIDWTGWKWVETDIPQEGYNMPIIFRYLWVQAKNLGVNTKSTLRFDGIKFLYTDEGADLNGPEFLDTTPVEGGLYKDTLDFKTTLLDSQSKVDPDTIKVTLNGVQVEDYTYNTENGELSFVRRGLADGDYTVNITAADTVGNVALPVLHITYHVDTAQDEDAPTLDKVTPRSNTVFPIQVPRPRINFHLQDEKSEVDTDSIKVTLNGKALKVYFDASTGYGYVQPDFDLEEGTATLTIDAADTADNAMKTWKDTFKVSTVAQPADPHNYRITIIPDTQGNAFSQKIFGRAAADNSKIVIHLGDIVDTKEQSDYDAAIENVKMVNKPVFVVAGNHEGLNMELYYETFNSPTYYFDYGDTRIIILNSAFGQSISYTDSTQYHWLEETLAGNTLPNVLVVNHVITRDDFYTDHNMTAAEAERFEGIMTAYKAKHPKDNVKVIFGHLHTLHNWNVDGVDYIIGGNAANKNYVQHGDGDILGSGAWTVKDGVAAYGFEPLLTKVYIKNAALYGDTITAASGAALQMDLYGDFREYPANYLTQINDDPLVDIAWSTSDKNIATVDDNGLVNLKGTGTAEITATCGGKSSTVKVKSVDPAQIQVIKLSLTLPESGFVGQRIIPTVCATDPYGSVFALDVKNVSFTCADGRLIAGSDGYLLAVSGGTATVTATYGGKTASAQIELSYQPSGHSSSKGSSSGSISTISSSDSRYIDGKNIVEQASSIEVNLTGTSTVASDSQMKELIEANRNKPVILNGENYSITFKKGTMSMPEGVTNFDFGLSFNTGKSFEAIRKAVGSGLALVVCYNYSGPLPAEAVIKIKVDSERAGETLYYYYYDEKTGKLEYVQSVAVDKDGYATVTQSHCSDYVLTTNIPVMKNADGILEAPLPMDGDSDTLVPYFMENNNEVIVKFSDVSKGMMYFIGDSSASYKYRNNEVSFADTENHWAKDSIRFVAARELLKGVSEALFSPDSYMTRGMAVTVIGRLCGADISGFNTSRFSDVEADSYCAGYIEWAAKNGIVSGVSDREFAPNRPVTREQLAVMLYNCAKYKGFAVLKVDGNATDKFSDASEISGWSKEAVAWAFGSSIISRNSDGSFTPAKSATRAETAAMLQRLIKSAVIK